jgi:flavodoxin
MPVSEPGKEYPRFFRKNKTKDNSKNYRKQKVQELFMKSLLVVFSYHHNNTEKIATVMANVLDAEITTPQKVNLEDLEDCSLAGFGSGIYSGKHDESLLDLADKLPQAPGKKAFIFSTCGVPVGFSGKEFLRDYTTGCHKVLREKLGAKGYVIIGEFSCAGFNTNSFLKYFGGLNKGKPDAEDMRNEEGFAEEMKKLRDG